MKKFFSNIRTLFNPQRSAAIIVTALALVVLIGIWWQARSFIEEQLVSNAKNIVQNNLDSYCTNIHQGILDKISLTESLTAYVNIEVNDEGDLYYPHLDEFAARLYQSTGRIKNIAIAPGGVIAYVYPYEENQSVLGYEPAVDQRPEVREQVQQAIDTGEVTLSQPVELIQGGLGLITRQAVFIDEKYWGLTNIVLDLPGLLDDAGLTSSSNIDLAIMDQNSVVFLGSESVFNRDPVTSAIQLPGGNWLIAGVPHQGWEQFYLGGIRIIDVMASIIMMLVGWMTYGGLLQQQMLTTLVEERTAALRKTEAELLDDIAIRKGMELEKDKLLASESHQRLIAETLTEITLTLNSLIDIDLILEEILKQISRLVPYETGNIVLKESGVFKIRAHSGYKKFGIESFMEKFAPRIGEIPFDNKVGLLGEPILIGDVTKEPDWVTFEETSWIRSFLSVPIKTKDSVLGMIRLDSSEVNTFSEEDISLLEPVANAAAIAMENAALFEKAKSEIQERIKAERQIRLLNDQLEERVRQRTQELENANRELEAFSYSISHDLRAPLRAVSGISEIFQEEYREVLDEQAFEYLARMADSSKKMSDLIEGLLTLTQIGRQEFDPTEFIIQDLATSTFQDLKDNVPEREISFTVKGEDEVIADHRLITALLTNLFSNAIKFTRNEPSAEIEFGSEPADDDVVFYVRDNGIGLEEDASSTIFEPFQRSALDEEFEGLGIGLAIAKRIVIRHGGKIWLTPMDEKGACFYFSLGSSG